MNSYADKIKNNEGQYINSSTKKNVGSKSIFQFKDNRSETIVQNKIKFLAGNNLQSERTAQLQKIANIHTVQKFPFDKDGNDLAVQRPQVRDIYSMARGILGPYGSPQIKDIHEKMEKSEHPLLSENAGVDSGWRAGKYEPQELSQLPTTGDWRDDKFAKHPFSMLFRPVAGAIAGGIMASAYKREQTFIDPFLYAPHRNPFDPLF